MIRPSNRGLASQVQVHDPAPAVCLLPVSAASNSMGNTGRWAKRPNREERIHETVFLSFSESAPSQIEQLFQLSSAEWRRLLHWLDVSGLALYLLDRFIQLGLRDALPKTVADCLQQRLDDNSKRTSGMVSESVAIQREFQEAGLSYAVMKGLSLSPVSVPRPELRHQFDLDYLIAEKSAAEARRILESRGYHLYAISEKTWEFKIHETPHVSMKDLYKDLTYRAVELHLEPDTPGQDSRLDRIESREMFGITMPVFSPVDLFLSQAMHAFKDVCSAFSRTAHLLEFYRHVLARYDDNVFWWELRARAENERRTCFGIGVVTYLITSVMGDFSPEALTAWTVEPLPPSIRLWVDLYGYRAVVGKHPGTKLYLLLQKELEAVGVRGKRSTKRSLLPLRLPPAVVRASADERLLTRIVRYRVQARFIYSRLRFHIVEGLRFAMESYRWRQHLDRLSS